MLLLALKLSRFTAHLRVIAVLVTLLAVCGFGSVPTFAAPRPAAAQDSQTAIRFASNAEAAPEFHLETLDGKPLTLASASGKVVLLNFWATWCGPCRMEIPGLIELQKQYKDSLQIISLLVDVDDVEDAKKFVADEGVNYPVAVATNNVRLKYGGVSALPTVFVIDTQGRIVQKHVGLFDPRLYELETRALLHLAIPLKVETFEDTGEIFLKNAKNATGLPGVDLSELSAEQKMVALHELNANGCTCGCKLTLAQCRIYDSACATSKARAAQIIAEVFTKKAPKSVQPTPSPSAEPGASGSPSNPPTGSANKSPNTAQQDPSPR
jgi:thiol-disulfide isomerase/thioredoxin